MDWFKHKTASLDDPDFNAILDEFGSDGYMMFFGLLEIYGREFSNTNSDGFLKVRLAFVARKLRKSSAKVRKFLNFCGKLINKPRFVYSIDGAMLSYKVPDFIDLASNWTKRQTKTPTEAPTEAPTAIRSRSRRRIKKKNKEGPPKPPWNTSPILKYPDWLNISLWLEYKKHRKEIKAGMTELAETKALNKLERFVKAGYSQEEIIDETIAQGWKGLFLPSGKTGKQEIKPTTYAQAQDAERRQMVKMLKEIRNDGKPESDSRGTAQTTHLLPHGEKVD